MFTPRITKGSVAAAAHPKRRAMAGMESSASRMKTHAEKMASTASTPVIRTEFAQFRFMWFKAASSYLPDRAFIYL